MSSRITHTKGKRQIASPDEMTFLEWTDDLNNSLRSFNIPICRIAEEWKDWVYAFISINPRTIISLPNMDDWREWAHFFVTDINKR